MVSGTMNNPASVIGTIADLSEILAEVDVDETEIVHLAAGQRRDGAGSTPSPTASTRPGGRDRQLRLHQAGAAGRHLLPGQDPARRPRRAACGPGCRRAPRSRSRPTPTPWWCRSSAVVERKRRRRRAGDAAADARPPERRELQVVFVVDGRQGRQTAGADRASPTPPTSRSLDGLAAGEQVVTGPYRALRKLEDGEPVQVTTPELDESDGQEDRRGRAQEPPRKRATDGPHRAARRPQGLRHGRGEGPRPERRRPRRSTAASTWRSWAPREAASRR